MKDLKLDLNGDIAIENHDLALVDGTDFIVQRLKTALRLFRGEWFLDTRAGVPYYETFYRKNPNLASVRSALREAIFTVEGVTTITKLNLRINSSNRTLYATFSVDTTSGSISMETEL